MQVSGTDPADTSAANFRKLIITRCQSEFEKNKDDEESFKTKAKEMEECTDPVSLLEIYIG